MQSTATVVLLAATASANKIRVIGAGQGRTGTDSLRVALNMLGFGPTYHMGELLGLDDDLARPVGPGEMLGLVGGHNEKWVEIEKNVSLGKPCDFGFITEHYNSAVDFPAHAALPQLLAAYPEAKVVLTTAVLSNFDPDLLEFNSYSLEIYFHNEIVEFNSALTLLQPTLKAL